MIHRQTLRVYYRNYRDNKRTVRLGVETPGERSGNEREEVENI